MRRALIFIAIILAGAVLAAREWRRAPQIPVQIAAISAIARGVATGTVTYVFDGDTIEVADSERVRYIGMNAPEVAHPEKLEQCFGREAMERNRELVMGKEVRLVPDAENRDKYGRLLRYVWVGDTFVDLALVREGYARVLAIPPNILHASEFKAAEQEARQQERGLWSRCK